MLNQHKVLGFEQEGAKLKVPQLRPDGTKILYVFPQQSFSYRSSEYGIDPSDSVTLLDILLHERFINIPQDHPNFVYNTDETTARIYMLEQIALAKQNDIVIDPDNHLGSIHINFVPDTILHAYHKNTVLILRARGSK